MCIARAVYPVILLIIFRDLYPRALHGTASLLTANIKVMKHRQSYSTRFDFALPLLRTSSADVRTLVGTQ